MAIELYPHQLEALKRMKNGCVLAGETGSGKSMTAVAYYYICVCKGGIKLNGSGHFHAFREPRDLYIITTAKKRDSHEWEEELSRFLLMVGENKDFHVNVVIDSWNKIKDYKKVYGAFFIFDEQRVVGRGEWVKSFLRIANRNKWILLSATPGDTWQDYIPLFIANGFYKNRTEFNSKHCVFSRFSKYLKVERYVDEGILLKHRLDILIPMDFDRNRTVVRKTLLCSYDKNLYKTVWRDRKDPYDNFEPIMETGKLFYILRKVVNSDASRERQVLDIFSAHKKLIIFYNFTYERDALRRLFSGRVEIGEWNGQVHSEVPRTSSWVYLVQYSAGSEGWNCITTDTIVFYSQSYSYRMTKQAEGRVDRVNTPFDILYYYYLRSNAKIDLAIHAALMGKKNFNEADYLKGMR